MKKEIISREAMESELENWGMSSDILAQVRAGERGVIRDGVELFVSPTAAKSASGAGSPLNRLAAEIRAEMRTPETEPTSLRAQLRPSAASSKPAAPTSAPVPSPIAKLMNETSQEIRLRLQREHDKRVAATRGKLPSKSFRRALGGHDPEAA